MMSETENYRESLNFHEKGVKDLVTSVKNQEKNKRKMFHNNKINKGNIYNNIFYTNTTLAKFNHILSMKFFNPMPDHKAAKNRISRKSYTAQKKFSIEDFFSKCNQIRRNLKNRKLCLKEI